jgi:raffinose/stachyose/melibiose transport system substrate-binding protein
MPRFDDQSSPQRRDVPSRVPGSLSRRNIVQAGIAGVTGVAASAAAGATPARRASAQDSGWQGEIIFYAQAYTPNSKQPNANQLTAFQEIADQYEQEHPGITITFVDEQFNDYLQTVRVKSSGGELWDIFWAQHGELNGTLPKGIARDLAPDFDKPNPYIEDTATWKEAMNQTVLAGTMAPSGAFYNVNGDFVGTAFFYNTSLFDQAGITAAPTTWTELFDVCQKLADAGITVCAGFSDPSWFGRHFLSDFYAPEYETIIGCDGSPGMSPQDEAAALKSGLLSTEDPRFMGWWPFFKRFTDFWSQEYLTQTTAVADEPVHRDFAAGETAMLYTGSWLPRQLNTIGFEFELSSFSFPTLTTEDIEFATGTDVAAVVGGPNAAYQYAMSTSESNKTMEEEGKEAAVLDFLHYIGTPEVIEKVVNELGSFAPTWPGTSAVEGLETFVEQANSGLEVVQIGNSSAKLAPSLERTFGLYLTGNIDDAAAASQVQTELDRAVQDFERASPDVDLDTCAT